MAVARLPHPARRTCSTQLMVVRVLVLVLLSISARTSALFPAEAPDDPAPPVAVLVELFTSEGCSSCPPADHLLRQLVERQPAAGVQVLGLSFHVDYWDHLGWRDPFSSSSWSARQRDYARLLHQPTVYTPQVVVDGQHSLVGSDGDGILAAISRAAQRSRRHLAIELAAPDSGSAEGSLVLRISSADAGDGRPSERLYVALVEDGLSSSVRRGENAGRELSHVNVVRALHSERAPGGGGWSLTVRMPTEPEWRRDELAAIAWLQDGRGAIAALGRWQNHGSGGAHRP